MLSAKQRIEERDKPEPEILLDFKEAIESKRMVTQTRSHDAFITEFSKQYKSLKTARDFPVGVISFQRAQVQGAPLDFTYDKQLHQVFLDNPELLEFRDKNYEKKEQWKLEHLPKKVKKPSPIKDSAGDYFGCKPFYKLT